MLFLVTSNYERVTLIPCDKHNFSIHSGFQHFGCYFVWFTKKKESIKKEHSLVKLNK